TTVIAVGDAPHDAMQKSVQRAFEAWSADEAEPVADPETFAPAPAPPARLALVHRPGAAQSELRIGHVALPRPTADYHPALAADMILGGQFVGPIHLNLAEGRG